MIKQNLSLGAIILAFGLFFGNMSVYADEVEVDCIATPTDAACIEATSDEPSDSAIEPTNDYIEYNNKTDAPVHAQDYPEVTDNCDPAVQNCLPHASEDDSTPEAEPTDDVEIIEEETEPVMWPVYVSLGSLGAAIVVFILLNFFTEQK